MRNREAGWSTVELVASITVLVIGLLSLAVGFHGTASLTRQTRENQVLGHAYRNLAAQLESERFEDVASLFGPGSGKDRFWCGDDNADSLDEQKIHYQAPQKLLAAGKVSFFDETTLPPGWRGFLGGLDLNADGQLSNCGPGGDGGGSGSGRYRILPTRVDLTVDSFEGPRTLALEFILTK